MFQLAFQSLGTVLVAVPAGLIATRVRLKWLLIAATLLTGTAFTLLVTLRSYPLLLAALYAAGGGIGAARAAQALAPRAVRAQRTSRGGGRASSLLLRRAKR
mgnify:CR=1 FL=1